MKILVDGIEVELKVGSDPEVFVVRKGQFISAHGLVPGTKENPHKVSDGAIQVDGMALEFNIDPASCEDSFVKNINSVMSQLKARIPKDMELSIVPTAAFGADYIKAQPLIARELGCSADYNAYTGKANPKPDVDAPFRTAAGHVHIGWTEGASVKDSSHFEVCRDVCKILDLYLGVPSVLKDLDTKRRELYGQAGAFRPKPYGMEYRVLSNFWLKSEDEIKWVYQMVKKAIESYLRGFRVTNNEAQQIINTSNKEAALLKG